MIALPAGCSDDTGTSSSAGNLSTAPITIKDKGPVTREAVDQLIRRKVGTVDYTSQDIVRNIGLTPVEGGTFVEIDISRPSSCHPGQVVGYVTTMTRQLDSILFLYSDVTGIRITLYGTTEDPATRDTKAAMSMMTRADFDAIGDWYAMNEANIGDFVSEYWVEPGVYDNWIKFGSQVISDPALLEQAQQIDPGTQTTP